MREYLKFYIGGEWVAPTELKTLDVINPATEQVAGKSPWARPPMWTRPSRRHARPLQAGRRPAARNGSLS